MQISLKLYASLMKYLPPEAEEHRLCLRIHEDTTPNQVLEDCSVPPEKAFLLLLNGVYIPPEKRGTPILKEGDVLAAWPPVAGG